MEALHGLPPPRLPPPRAPKRLLIRSPPPPVAAGDPIGGLRAGEDRLRAEEVRRRGDGEAQARFIPAGS